jgi:hypothetical protein
MFAVAGSDASDNIQSFSLYTSMSHRVADFEEFFELQANAIQYLSVLLLVQEDYVS